MKRAVFTLIICCFLLLAAAHRPAASLYAQSGPAAPARPAPDGPDKAAKIALDCRACHGAGKSLPYLGGAHFHKEAHDAYDQGYHAQAHQNGGKAATCLDCHALNHDMSTILPASDPASTINRANISKTCGSCHGNPSVMDGTGISERPFLAYQESAHARAIARGNTHAAVCTDCHNSHDIRPASDVLSTIFKANIPRTCARCHAQVVDEFNQSVHGRAVERGVSQSPVCTDCHGIHTIKPRGDARAALGTTACAACHQGVRLTQEFGVAGERVSSYEDSYHGLARKLGSSVAADCASCHGVHNILPSSDPRSMVYRANLVNTCGQCHPGAGDKFVMGKVHLDVPAADDAGSRATRWVRRVYLGLIILTIGAMAIHNALAWRKKARLRSRAERRVIVRMTRAQRWQHWLLLASFAVLVVTGFALKYPDSWLGALPGLSETVRRTSHRAAGVVLIAVAIFHVFYMLFTREGRSGLRAFLLRRQDLRDVAQNLRYYLGSTATKPPFDRFSYGEKAEYWAVVWGTLVMAVTGLMVWFKVGAFGFLPRWVIDVALAVHWYEAILATLAILVWHVYNVVFDPDVYPLNWALSDGRVSEAFYQEEHALDYERMKAAGTLQDDPQPPTEKAGEPETKGGLDMAPADPAEN